jgi:hypothetical protein
MASLAFHETMLLLCWRTLISSIWKLLWAIHSSVPNADSCFVGGYWRQKYLCICCMSSTNTVPWQCHGRRKVMFSAQWVIRISFINPGITECGAGRCGA